MSLTSNNASLQQILESINDLPDAENSGGNANVELCELTMVFNGETQLNGGIDIQYSSVSDSGEVILSYEYVIGNKTITVTCVLGTVVTFCATVPPIVSNVETEGVDLLGDADGKLLFFEPYSSVATIRCDIVDE